LKPEKIRIFQTLPGTNNTKHQISCHLILVISVPAFQYFRM